MGPPLLCTQCGSKFEECLKTLKKVRFNLGFRNRKKTTKFSRCWRIFPGHFITHKCVTIGIRPTPPEPKWTLVRPIFVIDPSVFCYFAISCFFFSFLGFFRTGLFVSIRFVPSCHNTSWQSYALIGSTPQKVDIERSISLPNPWNEKSYAFFLNSAVLIFIFGCSSFAAPGVQPERGPNVAQWYDFWTNSQKARGGHTRVCSLHSIFGLGIPPGVNEWWFINWA